MAALSARELDRLAEMTEGHTSLLESVVVNVRTDTLAKLARVLGVSIDWLVTGECSPPLENVVLAAVQAARAAKKPADSNAA